MKRNLHSNRYVAVASDGAANWDHPLNRGRVLWMLPGLPGTPAAGLRLLNLADPRGQTHGTLTNMVPGSTSGWGPTNRSGGFGQLIFDGTDDVVTTAGTPFNYERTQAFSVACWYRPSSTSSTGEALITTLDPASSFRGWELNRDDNGADSNTIQFFLINSFSGNCIQQRSTTTMVGGALYRVLMTYDGSSLAAGVQIYLNAKIETKPAAPHDTLSATAVSTIPLRLGARSNGTVLTSGTLADVSIWTRLLSASEVIADYRLSSQGYRVPDSPLRWISTRTYSVPGGATTLFRRTLTNRTGSRAAA